MISPAQSRAGRALVELSQEQLAEASHLGLSTIRDFEKGRRVPTHNNLAAIQRALEAAGVEFISENGGGAGVRLRKSPGTAQDLTDQIDALEGKVSNMPSRGEPSPQSGMDTMRKAVAENDLAKLRNRRSRIKGKGT